LAFIEGVYNLLHSIIARRIYFSERREVVEDALAYEMRFDVQRIADAKQL